LTTLTTEISNVNHGHGEIWIDHFDDGNSNHPKWSNIIVVLPPTPNLCSSFWGESSNTLKDLGRSPTTA
jgi:hypothetical protein